MNIEDQNPDVHGCQERSTIGEVQALYPFSATGEVEEKSIAL